MGHQFRNEPTPRSNTCAVAISARIFLPMYRRNAPNTGRASTNRFVVSIQFKLGRNPRLLSYRHKTICLPTNCVASRVATTRRARAYAPVIRMGASVGRSLKHNDCWSVRRGGRSYFGVTPTRWHARPDGPTRHRARGTRRRGQRSAVGIGTPVSRRRGSGVRDDTR